MEYYSGIKHDKSVTTAWNLENLMLSEKKTNLKDHYYMVLFIWNVQSSQIYEDSQLVFAMR